MRLIYLCDVGGSSIKANVALDNSAHPQLLMEQALLTPMDAKADLSTIMHTFAQCFKALTRSVLMHYPDKTLEITAVSIGFPGPFDYDAGISTMTGLTKYEALYGVPLTTQLEATLRSSTDGVVVSESVRYHFQNDARLFTYGAWYLAGAKPNTHTLGLTLGTGCGSGFVVDGHLLTETPDLFSDYGLPDHGYVYPLTLDKKRVDDQLSARGLLELAEATGLKLQASHELAPLANQGDLRAQHVYAQLGKWLEVLAFEMLAPFNADQVILGGRISQSLHWIARGFTNNNHRQRITALPDSSNAALLGALLWHFTNRKEL